MFNSLRYTQKLEEAGVPRKHAEAHVEVLSDIMVSHFATSQDLRDLEVRLDLRFRDVDSRFERLEQEMQKLEYRLTLKLGAIVVSTVGLCATIVTLIFKLA